MKAIARHWLVLTAIGALVGCGGRGGESARWVPEDADAVVFAPTIESVRSPLVAWLGAVEGASGVLDLVEARVGLDLRDREGLAATGIDPDTSVSLFVHEGTIGFAVGVTHPSRFDTRVARQVSRLGAAEVTTLHDDTGLSAIARARDGAEGATWSLAWGTGPDAVGLVVWSPTRDVAADVWRQWAGGRRDEVTLVSRASEVLDGRSGMYIRATGPPTIPSAWNLGPVKMLLAPLLSGLTEWEGVWVVEPQRLGWTMDGRWATEGAMAADWFQPAGDPQPLVSVIPKSQTLTMRARLNLQKILEIPAFLRKRVIPKRVPGAMGSLLPPIETLLTLLNGDVAVSLLGLDTRATIDHALRGKGIAEALQLVHGALLVGVTDASAARDAIDAAKGQLESAGWRTDTVDRAGWQGIAAQRTDPPTHWSILQRDTIIAILSGSGEVARFIEVAEGRALSVVEAAEGPVAESASSAPDVALGLSVGFRRITRELADKGFPPYFLQMINDLRAISGALRVRPDGATVELEVRL